MNPSRILETCLCVDDLDEAERFYKDVLGLEFYAKVPGRHVFFRCGDSMFLLFNPEATATPSVTGIPGHGTTGSGHVAFHMMPEEVDGWRDRLEERDVAIETEYEWPGGGFSIYFRDPAGNCLELATPQIWKLES